MNFLIQEKQREKDDAYNEYQFRIFDQQAYETQDLQNREFDFQNQKANLERDIAREIQNRESNLINYTNQRALERDDLIARFQFDIESRKMQRDQDVEMVTQQVEFSLQQFNF
ncbi:MAG: hypothetical protein CM15mP91_1590 [Chloroflexota bacterium]|nr:MAG: hypothetical protein CM15mP91_1590 [Chloroflexota bacterium]